jgi:AICAR transformylase/IMP cyclohydrolase PurH
MDQTITSTTTKGLVIGLILIILALASYFANIEVSGPVQWIGYAVFIGGIIWSVYSYGKQMDYNSTFGKYFAHGFKVAALVTAIMIIYVVIFIILFPDFKEKAIDKARISMREKNNLTEEQMTQAIEMTRKFFMVFLIGGTLVGYLILGALAALIGAAITKKQPNKFVGDINQIGK